MEIYEFSYNGFGGFCNQEKVMEYTVKFEHWTNDPGIFVGTCSDGQERLVPTYAIVDYPEVDLPEQDLSKMVYFGIPATS